MWFWYWLESDGYLEINGDRIGVKYSSLEGSRSAGFRTDGCFLLPLCNLLRLRALPPHAKLPGKYLTPDHDSILKQFGLSLAVIYSSINLEKTAQNGLAG